MIKVGMAQMLVEGGALEANLERACAMIREAGQAGCDVVVLPECLDVGWTHPSARTIAEPIPGKTTDCLCAAAREHAIFVVAGVTERAGDCIYNTAILVAADGEILLKHRKINILDIARDLYTAGECLRVAETPWGRVGLLICADNFPETRALGESLALMGAKTIFSPCAWAVPADHDNLTEPYGALWRDAYESLSRAHGLSIVGVSNVGPVTAGPWEGRRCIGCSLAMGPEGTVLESAPYGVDAACLRIVSCPVG
ncbi:MAG: carbon-nitrogen hydrolase family protein [Candidatus Hydrogenedentes bacterium]|nr:carbon-nitrogen hydrolase family protein [Candidatus Hydrogenedentota bacterium]